MQITEEEKLLERYLYGRELLLEELPEKVIEKIRNQEMRVERKNSFVRKRKKTYCNRCDAEMTKTNFISCTCARECFYCRNCIQMGKVRACQPFYYISEKNEFTNFHKNQLKWEGNLSKQQAIASKRIAEAIENKKSLLLWAVTGAGKTEMLFAGIERALLAKKRVCIATPRIDVVLELAPRILAAFPKTELILLYGQMETPYEYTQLVLATTHQLYRFREAFDVLVIDEVDAFPFHLDDSLAYATEKAKKQDSTLIYLSATPDQKLRRKIKNKQFETILLPARYHGYSLPVPIMKRCKNWEEQLLHNLQKTSFGKQLAYYIHEKKRFLIFAPNIQWMLQLEKILRKKYANIRFETVYAEDPNRKEKVLQMRDEELQFLITTTILERGVTFPNIHVLVVGAEDQIFTESALVQIAGRCGRAANYPKGDVLFFHNGKSLAMKRAIKQIKQMNKLARKRGLLHE